MYITKSCESPRCPYANPQPIANFGKRKDRKDGLYPYCRLCAQAKARKSYEKHKEQQNLRRKQRYKENPEKAKASAKQFKEKNPNYQRDYFAKKKKQCAVKCCETLVTYSALCLTHALRHSHYPELTLDELSTFVPPFFERWKLKEWAQIIYSQDNYQCQLCQSKDNLNAHHIKPKAQYPKLAFDLDNGTTLCESCHRALHKGN